eukprot:1552301-Rhodomonas_salina.1
MGSTLAHTMPPSARLLRTCLYQQPGISRAGNVTRHRGNVAIPHIAWRVVQVERGQLSRYCASVSCYAMCSTAVAYAATLSQ